MLFFHLENKYVFMFIDKVTHIDQIVVILIVTQRYIVVFASFRYLKCAISKYFSKRNIEQK